MDTTETGYFLQTSREDTQIDYNRPLQYQNSRPRTQDDIVLKQNANRFEFEVMVSMILFQLANLTKLMRGYE